MSGQEQEDNKQGKAIRERTFKVRLSESEYQLLDSNNPYGSIAKLLRQAAVEKATKIYNSKADDDQKIKPTKVVESSYTKTERALILELSRIGTNVNQIAKAVNTLWMQDGQLYGDNTDGQGLVAAIQALNWNLEEDREVIVFLQLCLSL